VKSDYLDPVLLLALTAGDNVPDLPPGWEVSSGCNGVWFVRFGAESWVDEFDGATREEARAECWRRFCEAEPEWSELLARLLSADPTRQASRTMIRLFG
jgi:hypothetical protein